jgi:hypothetical protein
MRPRRLWLIFIGVLVLVALVVVVTWPDREPKYQGRSLSEWVAGYDIRHPRHGKIERDRAIRQFGTNALPYLLKWIQYQRPPWKNALNRISGGLLAKYHLLLEHKDETRAEQAEEVFRALGPEACAAAIPDLLRLMNNSKRSLSAARAMYTLVGMGTNARPALPALITLLTNANDGAPYCAISALGDLKLEPQLVVPALTPCLLSSNLWTRSFAAEALGRFGGEAHGAVPALVRALGDSDARVQYYASNALWKIEPQALERVNAPAAEAAQKAE